MESTSENEQTRAIKTGDHPEASGHNQQNKPSKSELLASAKVMADAARHRSDNKVDKAEVAGAAANLLHAGSEYGKLEDKPLGKYVEKAENHLRQYRTSHSTTNSGHSTATTGTTHSSTNHPGKDHRHSSVNSGGDQQGGKGKYEDHIKLAEGLAEGILKKHSGGGSHTNESSTANTHPGNGGEHGSHFGSGNGYGQYVKMAGDLLKKH